jgi:hypothetical protein
MDEVTIKAKLDMGVSPLDLMHGYIKELMYDTQCLQENAGGNADYLEGRMDALGELYGLTYRIGFAGGE